MLMAVEDQGSGTQYVRVNSWPIWKWAALSPLIIILLLALTAALNGAWLIASGMGLVGILAVIRGIEEAGSAQSVRSERASPRRSRNRPCLSHTRMLRRYRVELRCRPSPCTGC